MKTSVSNNHGKSEKKKNQGTFFRPELQFIVFAVALALIVFLIFHFLYKMQYSGTSLYFNFASRVLDGNVPYRDFAIEYPPFALFFFILPRFFTSDYWTYAIYYRIEVFIFILIGLFILYSIAQRLGKSPWKMMAIYTASILAIGPIIAEQYDVFPAVMTLLALYYFWLGRYKTAWALLALGALTKIYPLFIAPIFLVYHLRNRQYRPILSGIVTFAAIGLLIFLPFLIISPSSILYLVNYHGQRGIQLESIYSSFLLIADKLGLVSVRTVMSFGSWNLLSPLSDILAKLSTYIMGLCLLITYWFIYKQIKPGKSQFTRLGTYALLVTMVTLIFGKVLSPQYLIWLIPFIPLVFGPLRNTVLITFIAIGILTYLIFPVYYLELMILRIDSVLILFIRNVLLILLAVMAIVSLQRMKSSD
jgi:uncharacterized membrane protein